MNGVQRVFLSEEHGPGGRGVTDLSDRVHAPPDLAAAASTAVTTAAADSHALPATLLTGDGRGRGGELEPTHMNEHAQHSTHTTTHQHHPHHHTHTNTHHLPPTNWSDGVDDDRNDGLNLAEMREEQSASQAGRTAEARGGTMEGMRVTAEDDGPHGCSCCTHTTPGHGHGT